MDSIIRELDRELNQAVFWSYAHSVFWVVVGAICTYLAWILVHRVIEWLENSSYLKQKEAVLTTEKINQAKNESLLLKSRFRDELNNNGQVCGAEWNNGGRGVR